MPKLNPKKHKITTQKQKDNDFLPINKKVVDLENTVLKLTNRLCKLEKQQLDDIEFKEKFNTFISYTDKKRMNTIQKDVNLMKKQINLSKTSKILKGMNELKERMDKIEDTLDSIIEDDDEAFE